MTTSEKTVAGYRQALIMALRLKDVPGERIGELVAEVESHVADTGEDPTEAFGSPTEYAASLTSARRPEPLWHTAAAVVFAAIAGWFGAQGALAVLLQEEYLGRSGWLWLVLGVGVGVPVGLSVQRRSTLVRDPRTGGDMVPASWWGPVALIGLPAAIIVLSWGLIEIYSR